MATPPPQARPDYSDLECVSSHIRGSLAQGHGIEVYSVGYDPPEAVWAEYHTTLPMTYSSSKEGSQHTKQLPPPPPPPPTPTIWGIRRKTFWILTGVLVFIIVGAVGGGVGGYFASRKDSPVLPDPVVPDSANRYQNLSITALRWVDNDDSSYYSVFHQPADQTRIFESSRRSDDKSWTVSPITDVDMSIMSGTPLASVAGYPHTNITNGLVKSVYITDPAGTIIERQSPYKTEVGVWGNDNFSGQYVISKASSMFSYWYQNFDTRFQILAVFFQELGANSLTIAKYVENVTDGEPWQTSRQSLSIQDGSSLVAAPAGGRGDLRLYVGGTDGTLKQYPYDLETNVLGSAVNTAFDFEPRTPICVTTADYRASYTRQTLPECARTDTGAFNTHFILFATADRKSLTLVSWNCSSGFIRQQNRIEKLLRPDRTYLDLSATMAGNLTSADDRVYVLFDGGNGPEIEEWQVHAGESGSSGDPNEPWELLGSVPTTPQ
ncbi:uncharacterized protein DNG_09063 [Cephalotrichum gorgonifer]|uniref:Fucose-specific lectin n=1 Tax=Cephalotrichum gorgonifer TaxID=2041049 RepID=A0AAE8SZ12_9PEZI|nr:uncharacterized protein DNG_09063 [Cephalotrichum gorgonifer]